MENITLHLPLGKGESTAPHAFALKAGDPNGSPGESLTFKSTGLIHHGHSRVFRGLLSGGEYLDVKSVCKLAPDTEKTYRRFQREAEVYQMKLRDMQGYFIPRFYGLYTGSISGEPTSGVLLAIHKRSIQHNDFYPRNIVVDNVENPQRLVIIDFEHAKDHECQRRYQIALYDLPPDRGDFNCNEVYEVAEYTEVWTLRTIEFFGGLVPVNVIASAEDLVRYGPSQEGLFEPEVVLRVARHILGRYLRTYAYRKPCLLGESYKALDIAI